MKNLQELAALHKEIDDTFKLAFAAPTAVADQQSRDRTKRKRLINEQAYFLLCWGQIENEINDACATAIERRRNDHRWEMRRGFDFYDPADTRLRFERRVALVLDRTVGRGGAYAKVLSYYQTRNNIAHGALASVSIDLQNIIEDFYIIQAAIQT